MSDKPHFRFNPDAYKRGTFEESQAACAACGKPCVWRFVGIVYAEDAQPIVCARCIADGGLSRLISDYCLHDMEFEDEVDADLADEVDRRTPGFSTFNPFLWPVRDGEPLAFVGYGDDAALKAVPGVVCALQTLAEETGDDDFAEGYALIFKALEGDDYVAVLDLD